MDNMPEIATETIRRVAWSGETDTGRFRKSNEDAFLALTMDSEGVKKSIL